MRSRERTTLEALVEALVPRNADVRATVDGVALALDRMAPHRRTALLRFLHLLDVPAAVTLMAGRPVRFAAASRAEREAVLLRLAAHPLQPLRSGFAAFKRLVLFVAYAVDDNGRNPLWNAMQYPGPRCDVPPFRPAVPVSSLRPGTLSADVVVVGSGAGGGVAAAMFASAGLRTVVLEAGPDADNVARSQREALAVSSLYLESGTAATTDAAVSILAGACVGGGTTVNWCTCLRMRDSTQTEWERACGVVGLGWELADAYDAVEARLAAVDTRYHNANNAVIVRGCERLGWRWQAIPRNASGCGDGCGYCGFGCAYGNKRGTASTYLSDAVRSGAQVFAGVRVLRVVVERGRTRGVEAVVGGHDGGNVRVEAPLVVLAAGALRTPQILAAGGIRSAHLGRHLRLHPTSAISAEFDEPVEAWKGPMQTAVCDQFSDDGSGYGVTLECAPAHPGLAALALPWLSAEHHADAMRRFRNAAVLIALTRDRGEGSISLDGRDDIRYALGRYDAGNLNRGLIAAATIAFAAGARRVTTLHTTPVTLERQDARDDGIRVFADAVVARGTASNRLVLFSAHQMGTARMHARKSAGVVDRYGAVHGVRGLLVVDASAFPRSSGVNPMLTIMALAQRACAHALECRSASPQRNASTAPKARSIAS